MGEDQKEYDKMIRTWIADVSPLYDENIYKKYYDIVPCKRKGKADRIRKREDQALSIGAWVLYQKALEQSDETEESTFNLSHSGKYALCSIACKGQNVKVGCDIEKIKKFHEKIVRRHFCCSEQKYLFEIPEEKERTGEFYRYWVLKESFVKATRYGLSMGLDSFEIQCMNHGTVRLLKQPEYIQEHYFFHEYQKDGNYKIAVCSTDSQFSDVVQEIKLI